METMLKLLLSPDSPGDTLLQEDKFSRFILWTYHYIDTLTVVCMSMHGDRIYTQGHSVL